MSDDHTGSGQVGGGGLDEMKKKAFNKYVETTNHAVAHAAATHDRALLDSMRLEVSAAFNRGYAALADLDDPNHMDN